jgi:hypothetical protein
MAEPTRKSKEINSFIDSILPNPRVRSIKGDICVSCGKGAKIFRNHISKKEYTISGLCQNCQDMVFGKD